VSLEGPQWKELGAWADLSLRGNPQSNFLYTVDVNLYSLADVPTSVFPIREDLGFGSVISANELDKPCWW
jgi:hypothetical protein